MCSPAPSYDTGDEHFGCARVRQCLPRAEDAEIKILIAAPDKGRMRKDPSSASAAAKRLGVMFASPLVAFAIGSATHSVEVFVAVMAVGVVVGLALRATDAFGPSRELKHVPGPMTSSTEPVDSLVYAPLRVRINCVSTAFLTGFMVVAFLGALLGWAIDSLWAFLVVGLLVVFPTVWAIGRGARVRLVASSDCASTTRGVVTSFGGRRWTAWASGRRLVAFLNLFCGSDSWDALRSSPKRLPCVGALGRSSRRSCCRSLRRRFSASTMNLQEAGSELIRLPRTGCAFGG